MAYAYLLCAYSVYMRDYLALPIAYTSMLVYLLYPHSHLWALPFKFPITR